MTARGSKSSETGWPVLVRLYRAKNDWAGSTRYKTVQGAARGWYYKLDNPAAVGGPWIIDGDDALYLEGCTVKEFLALVAKEQARSDVLTARVDTVLSQLDEFN